jgi:hypothetical protein
MISAGSRPFKWFFKFFFGFRPTLRPAPSKLDG